MNAPQPALASTTEVVRIHYRRPPDREDIFVQQLLDRTRECAITFMPATPLPAPVLVNDSVVLEDGSAAIWFTFRAAWHDIGLFHLRDGTFTGTYANAITPVHFLDDNRWETTDLFLDFWLAPDGTTALLDEDEFEHAIRNGWLDAASAERARSEMAAIERSAATGDWPPPMVREWDLKKARARLSTTSGTPSATEG